LAVVTTHAETGEVLMFAWMNAEALARTLELGEAVYFSRSREEIWHKGATSGQIQQIVEMRIDCDQDCLWLKVLPQGDGGACHVGFRSCFYRVVEDGKLVERP
jgi:phosphoribosyl-AMP cyclohydrolase